MWKFFLILAAVLYGLFPYDILPDFIVGWGWLDDLVILLILWRVFTRLKQKVSTFQHAQHAGYEHEHRSEESEFGRETPREDPYAVLGVSRDAAPDEIKQAYRRLAGQYHPDKVSHLGEEFRELAEKRFKEIQEAYQALLKSRKS